MFTAALFVRDFPAVLTVHSFLGVARRCVVHCAINSVPANRSNFDIYVHDIFLLALVRCSNCCVINRGRRMVCRHTCSPAPLFIIILVLGSRNGRVRRVADAAFQPRLFAVHLLPRSFFLLDTGVSNLQTVLPTVHSGCAHQQRGSSETVVVGDAQADGVTAVVVP